jgi:hypothetical protein
MYFSEIGYLTSDFTITTAVVNETLPLTWDKIETDSDTKTMSQKYFAAGCITTNCGTRPVITNI